MVVGQSSWINETPPYVYVEREREMCSLQTHEDAKHKSFVKLAPYVFAYFAEIYYGHNFSSHSGLIDLGLRVLGCGVCKAIRC